MAWPVHNWNKTQLPILFWLIQNKFVPWSKQNTVQNKDLLQILFCKLETRRRKSKTKFCLNKKLEEKLRWNHTDFLYCAKPLLQTSANDIRHVPADFIPELRISATFARHSGSKQMFTSRSSWFALNQDNTGATKQNAKQNTQSLLLCLKQNIILVETRYKTKFCSTLRNQNVFCFKQNHNMVLFRTFPVRKNFKRHNFQEWRIVVEIWVFTQLSMGSRTILNSRVCVPV